MQTIHYSPPKPQWWADQWRGQIMVYCEFYDIGGRPCRVYSAFPRLDLNQMVNGGDMIEMKITQMDQERKAMIARVRP